MKMYEGKILTVAKNLISENGKTTTLEIKNVLRQLWPDDMWVQEGVSKTMDTYYDTGGLTFDDMGTYRVYKLKQQTKIAAKISRSKLIKQLKEESGKTVKMTWIKNDGKTRVAEGVTIADDFMSSTGYILLRTDDGIKSVDSRTLKSAELGNVVYKVKT